MSLFLLTFFLIYGGVHAYAFVRARQAFGFGAGTGAAIALFLVLMVMAPLLVRLAERHGLEITARILAYTGYCWMGLLFFFFTASLCLDLYRLVLALVGFVSRSDLGRFAPSPMAAFAGPLLFAIVTAIYSFNEALHIRTERIVVASPKIPAGTHFTVAQLSDVHVGLIVRQARVARIVTMLRQAAPDMVVSTGDLVDGQLDEIGRLAELFRGVAPRFGMYAVTGNHEFYAGLPQALDFTRLAGFRLLRGEAISVNDWLTVAGVDDPAGGGWRHGAASPEEARLFAHLHRDRFILFLKHRPVVDDASRGRFDLQLSGHIHKGQLFPFNLVTYLFYPVRSGSNPLPDGSLLYVSRGTGTWGPPMRFLAPPEITLIELVHGTPSR